MADTPTRIANYTAKVTAARTSDQVESQLSGILQNAQAAMVSIADTDQQVRAVLASAGVTMIQYAFYMAFGRELWSLRRRGVAGETFAIEVATLIAKWVARGLTQATLQRIRTEVFDVGAPVAP